MPLRRSRALAVVLVTFATFTDLIAYSICVPALPDVARRLGASPTMIGFLFGSFGITLLAVSVPMGALSDRTGRKLPLVLGMVTLAGATVLFAVADSVQGLFAARMMQGAADGVTWVVGFALIADLYGAEERGRVMGYVMSGTSLGIMIGPSIGGWLYEIGGLRLPFAFVAVLALVAAGGCSLMRVPRGNPTRRQTSMWSVIRVPAVALCAAAVVVTGATIAMLEPVLALFFNTRLGLTPARIGLLFGIAAIVPTVLPFVYGPLTDRWGGRRLTLVGLVVTALWIPVMSTATSFQSALVLIVVQWTATSLIVTPSLAYMAEVTAFAGGDAYGVGYGVYNTAWGVGLLVGPPLGGWLFERLGFAALSYGWSAAVVIVAVALWGVQFPR
jgi:MFS transporter, DHA1 family, solute carrier family 18 (vesicular amine transporter), member 1/2